MRSRSRPPRTPTWRMPRARPATRRRRCASAARKWRRCGRRWAWTTAACCPNRFRRAPLPAVGFGGDEAARLQALNADPRYRGIAAYERFRAQQALDALAAARSSQRAALQALARRASPSPSRRRRKPCAGRPDDLDRQRSGDGRSQSPGRRTRAPGAERLRLEARYQAEEAERLQRRRRCRRRRRGRTQETVVQGVGDAERAKLKAARDREARGTGPAETRNAAGSDPIKKARHRTASLKIKK